MAVHLNRIYTRTGDAGSTRLGNNEVTAKTDPRVAAYADADECNAAIGVALAMGALAPDVKSVLTAVQNDLFDVGADLCNPLAEDPPYPPLGVPHRSTTVNRPGCSAWALPTRPQTAAAAGSGSAPVARSVTTTSRPGRPSASRPVSRASVLSSRARARAGGSPPGAVARKISYGVSPGAAGAVIQVSRCSDRRAGAPAAAWMSIGRVTSGSVVTD